MTSKEIDSYDVGTIPVTNRLWSYFKQDKVWMYSIKYMGWLFVFCFFDPDVKLLTTDSHFKYHILDEKNKGYDFDESPKYIQQEFEYHFKTLVEDGIIKKKEDDNSG